MVCSLSLLPLPTSSELAVFAMCRGTWKWSLVPPSITSCTVADCVLLIAYIAFTSLPCTDSTDYLQTLPSPDDQISPTLQGSALLSFHPHQYILLRPSMHV